MDGLFREFRSHAFKDQLLSVLQQVYRCLRYMQDCCHIILTCLLLDYVCSVLSSCSYSFSDCIAADRLLQSVHSDLYLHHLTCYHCRVDKGWNHTVLWWDSLPALTGGDWQTVLYLWQHSYFNWSSSQFCGLLHLHSQQQIWVQQSRSSSTRLVYWYAAFVLLTGCNFTY